MGHAAGRDRKGGIVVGKGREIAFRGEIDKEGGRNQGRELSEDEVASEEGKKGRMGRNCKEGGREE